MQQIHLKYEQEIKSLQNQLKSQHNLFHQLYSVLPSNITSIENDLNKKKQILLTFNPLSFIQNNQLKNNYQNMIQKVPTPIQNQLFKLIKLPLKIKPP